MKYKELIETTSAGGIAAVSTALGSSDPNASIYGPTKKKKTKMIRRISEMNNGKYDYESNQQNNMYEMKFKNSAGVDIKVKMIEVSHDSNKNQHKWIIKMNLVDYTDSKTIKTIMEIIKKWTMNFEFIPKKITIIFNNENKINSKVIQYMNLYIKVLANRMGMDHKINIINSKIYYNLS